MSDSGSIQSRVRCEYFKRIDHLKITCAGLYDNSIITQSFRRKDDFEKQVNIFCEDAKHCSYCEIYRAIQEARGEEE